jgi:hypothetical protein
MTARWKTESRTPRSRPGGVVCISGLSAASWNRTDSPLRAFKDRPERALRQPAAGARFNAQVQFLGSALLKTISGRRRTMPANVRMLSPASVPSFLGKLKVLAAPEHFHMCASFPPAERLGSWCATFRQATVETAMDYQYRINAGSGLDEWPQKNRSREARDRRAIRQFLFPDGGNGDSMQAFFSSRQPGGFLSMSVVGV